MQFFLMQKKWNIKNNFVFMQNNDHIAYIWILHNAPTYVIS